MSRTLGYSLLAAAVSTSLAMAQDAAKGGAGGSVLNGTWSYSQDRGLNFTTGDSFGINLASFIQARYEYASNENTANTNNFDVPRARTGIGGHAFNRQINYFLLLDYADDGMNGAMVNGVGIGTATGGILRDAWVQWDFMSDDSGSIGVRVGQAKSYFGLEATGYADGFWFVDRSLASQTFSSARSRGAWLHGTHADKKLRWNFGAQNSDVAAGADGIADTMAANADNELTFVGNVSFDPMGNFFGDRMKEFHRQGALGGVEEARGTIGGGLQLGNNRNAGNTTDVESMSFNLNTAWALPGNIGVQAEFFSRNDDPDTGIEQKSQGWYVQGMYALPRSGDSELQWGLGLRIGQAETKDSAAFFASSLGGTGDVMEISAVVNAFYHGHNCKTQLEYTWQDVNPDGATDSTNHIIRVAFQLAF